MITAAVRTVLLGLAVAVVAAVPRPADAYYVASATGTTGGLNVNVSAIVDISPTGLLTVSLTNNEVNLTSRIQEISGFQINFKSGLAASVPQQSIAGTGQTILISPGGSNMSPL